MVRASSIIALVFTMVCGTQAANWYCQCLYPDGSHCCNNADDCTSSCLNAVSNETDKACNAGGKNSRVSYFNAQFRTTCHET
ncbi:uncharacterized protein SETTUDRAFT_24721 [Exserohilum turcica Et28A]|uniref:Uncharacterized protein n=1 Tax=Exserohilum turcicum (strain 28A) TaxID=671987 RepID=R0J0U3_EXST2|nr:uncharacterized protein SETTUDRAFT_24721 [Exserohilum turcica Et28A]EOA90575.1 hypothetical protein SETTUDRAFT_24721 [Exserohilum turcica Et28A]